MDAPIDNLVRSGFIDRAVDVEEDGSKLTGYFSMYDNWYLVDSVREGRFMERIAPGAFDQTLIENRDRIKVLYDHGMDPQLGNKSLGTWEAGSDTRGAWYAVDLIDTDYNRGFIIPAGKAGLLGSSFRFSVADRGEQWDKPTRSTDYNPGKLRERTITRADVFEFGPVTFPANPAAFASVRSTTDEWINRLLHDPRTLLRFAERVGPKVVEQLIASLPDDVRSDDDTAQTPVVPADGRSQVRTIAQRRALVAALNL
jgi:HK97 family phage prohead protease